MMVMNGTVVEHWSRTQATPALSTTAEYCAVITGAAEVLGKQSMLMDLGLSASSSRDRLQRCQSDRVKEKTGKNRTRRVDVLVVAERLPRREE